MIINYHQYWLLVYIILVFKAFAKSFFAFLIISIFLFLLVLCYSRHIAFAFNYLWFKSLSVLTIIVNQCSVFNQNLIVFSTLVLSCISFQFSLAKTNIITYLLTRETRFICQKHAKSLTQKYSLAWNVLLIRRLILLCGNFSCSSILKKLVQETT